MSARHAADDTTHEADLTTPWSQQALEGILQTTVWPNVPPSLKALRL